MAKAARKAKPPAKAPSGKTGESQPKPGKIEITPELRRIWIRARRAWVTSYQAFSYSLSTLDARQSGLLYEVVRHSLFKNSHAEILRTRPELREFLQTDDDRLCMHDIYEVLSWRLNRREKPPQDVRLSMNMKGTIGRESPDLSG